jgi:hypothetical protein
MDAESCLKPARTAPMRSIQRKGKYKRRIAGSHMDGAAPIKERQDDLGRTTRTITTRGAKCIEVGVGFSNNYNEV